MIQQIGEQEAQAYFERLDPLVRPGTVPIGMVRDVVLTHYRVPEGL